MKVLIFWSHVSGYMGACWRALAAHPGVDLFVVARRSGGQKANTAFRETVMQGVPCELLDSDAPIKVDDVRRVLSAQKPDIVVINGWHTPTYTRIPQLPEAAGARFIMAMDTPYRGTLRQRLGGIVMRSYFSRVDRVFVTGERCWQLAVRFGFPERVIRRGVYGVDLEILSPLHARRLAQPGGWPQRFLTTGRYVSDKGIDILVEGYSRYRRKVKDPWPLSCCGQGPMGDLIRRTKGATDLGFIQPDDLPGVLVEHGVFVLASRFDPWPLAIVEACAAGLPIACSEACGTRVELVRSCYNGRSFATADPEDLATALMWMHEHYEHLPEMGARSRTLADPYSALMWVERWVDVFHELLNEKGGERA